MALSSASNLTLVRNHPFWHAAHAPTAVHAGKHTAPLGDQLFIAVDFVFVKYPCRSDSHGARGQRQHIVVARSIVVTAIDIVHDHQRPFLLEAAVVVPGGAQLFNASHFKIGKVVRVVNASLGIGLLVPHAERNLMLS